MALLLSTCWTQNLSLNKPALNRKRDAIKLKKRVFNLKKIVMLVVFLLVCVALYLLALNSYCDQGGNFDLGVCAVTSFIPW